MLLLHCTRVKIWNIRIRRGPDQDVDFFYMGSHSSELQSCTLTLSTHFHLFSHLNSARHSLVIKLCRALKIFWFFPQLFSTFAHSFVAIELLNFFINAKFHFYYPRELSVFCLNKLYSLSRQWSTKKSKHSSKLIDWHFSIFRVFT